MSHQFAQYFAWKPNPFSQRTDGLQQIRGNQFLYAFPPFCLILQVLKKVSYDQTKKMLLVPPTWQSQIWYPLLLEMPIVRPLLLPSNKKPTGGSSSSNCKQNITTSGVDHIREILLKKGVSKTAAQLITSTRRKSSQSNYNLSWRMWASWCDKQQVDAFRCDAI